MDSIFYDATTYWVIGVNITIALGTLWLYRQGRASLSVLGIAALIFGIWITTLHLILGGQHVFPKDLNGGAFFLIILAGAGALVGLFYLTSRKYFDRLSQENLQLVQGLRVFVGGGFLMEGVLEVIPGWFSIMDGFMHLASAFFALVAAILFLKKTKSATAMLWTANIIGLLDIFTIVTSICFVVWNDLGPFHNMNYVVFGAGPALLWIHFISIRKLLSKNA